jgi:hypothetical protein
MEINEMKNNTVYHYLSGVTVTFLLSNIALAEIKSKNNIVSKETLG